MIVYEPNKHFLGDIGHLARSWTMVRIGRGVLIVGIFSLAICWPMEHFGWSDRVALNMAIFSFLGVVLSILLVFRTNSAYDRWWEGRKQWGALVNHSRNLAIQVHAAMPREDQALRQFFARRISNFSIALSEHLRNGTDMDQLIGLSQEERSRYATRKHLPNHISREIHQRVEDAHRAGLISDPDLLNFKPQMQALLDILGACERIRKTPIAFSYAVYIKLFIVAYTALLPFALVHMFGLWTVLIVMFVFFAFIGVEMMASEIEDPFGLDCNDLPTGTIARTIRDNVYEILDVGPEFEPVPAAGLYEKIF